MDDTTLLMALLPVLVVSLGLQIWALVDLSRTPQPRHLPRWAWVLIVVFVTLGSVVYLIVGRDPFRAR